MRGRSASGVRRSVDLRTCRPSTEDSRAYRWLLRKHIAPHLGGVPLGKLDTALIREWRSDSLCLRCFSNHDREGVPAAPGDPHDGGEGGRASSLATRAVCPAPTRRTPPSGPVLTLSQVLELADLVPRRYRASDTCHTFASLRFGGLIAFQRRMLTSRQAPSGFVRHSRRYAGMASFSARRSHGPARRVSPALGLSPIPWTILRSTSAPTGGVGVHWP